MEVSEVKAARRKAVSRLVLGVLGGLFLFMVSVTLVSWWLVNSFIELEFEQIGEPSRVNIKTPLGTIMSPMPKDVARVIGLPIYPGAENLEHTTSIFFSHRDPTVEGASANTVLRYRTNDQLDTVKQWYRTSLVAEFRMWSQQPELVENPRPCDRSLGRNLSAEPDTGFSKKESGNVQHIILSIRPEGKGTTIVLYDCIEHSGRSSN